MKKAMGEVRRFNAKSNRSFNTVPDLPKYMMQLASEIGCNPPDYKAMLKPGSTRDDLELGLALYYGPMVSAQYRLRGPGVWEGAREHVINISKQVLGTYFDELLKEYLA